MASEINQLLEELHKAGLLESRGAFSIDFLKASNKMATRRLPDSRMYIMRLVQSAVSGGSQRIDVDHSFKTLTFRGHGWALPHQDIRQLQDFLLKNSQTPSQYLAVALNAALQQKPERLHLVSWDGQAGVSLSFVGDQEGLENLTVCPFRSHDPQTCFTIVHRQSWFFRQLPELEWLKHCTLSPTPIQVNGTPLESSFGQHKDLTFGKFYLPFTYVSSSTNKAFGKNRIVHANNGHHLLLGRMPALFGDSQSELLRIPNLASSECLLAPPNHAWLLLKGRRGDPPDSLVRAAIGLRADLREPASVRFVIHGVSLDPVPLEVARPGVEAVAVGSGLATDLSGCKILEDELRPRLQDLQERAHQMWRQHLLKWGDGDVPPKYQDCMAHAISGDTTSVYSRF